VCSYDLIGTCVPAHAYPQAKRLQGLIRADYLSVARQFDALILPTVTAEAPGRAGTGDSSLQEPFSLVGLPAISVPTGLSSNNLPYGIQLVGSYWADEQLLTVAGWCQNHLPAMPPPPAFPVNGRGEA